MNQNSCGLHEEAREHYRLHHCGTCKAIGTQYRQPARLFLNFDCVFLAELLSALADEDTSTWPDSYHSFICFASDGQGVEPPLPLRFAAATNVLLSALKTDDHLKDAPNLFWRTLKRWFDPDFQKAEKEMAQLGLDMDAVWYWIGRQQQREKNGGPEGVEALKYYSEPTARITAEVFSKGAALMGRPTPQLYQVGFQLGELVYVLDALEDLEKDKKNHQFNALHQAWGQAHEASRQATADYLFALSRQIKDALRQLPLPAAVVEEFQGRLSANVAVRVSNAMEGKRSFVRNLERSLFARVALRIQSARSLARQLIRPKHPWVAAPQYAVSFLAVLVLPETAKQVQTSPGHGVAFTAVLAAFFSTLIFWPKIRQFFKRYKAEIKRLKKKMRKGKPEKEDKTFNTILWVVGIVALILIILVIVLAIECANTCNECEEDCYSSC